ncbi:MAG: DUF2063 domain-containing protein [Phyllobacteriaceae bacterium]|nr:DUF2063 domain-containing protein [Phyllobacteriaceae bacterium]MBA90031.1 DUF2063 domain-containing protein [Phyllobacteriaceae bacterium]
MPPAEKAWNRNAFAGALTDPLAPMPAGVTRRGGGGAVRRFAVYRNNVVHSLVTAIADIFPAVAALTGKERFAHAARLYLEECPPRSPILAELGRDFPAFLDRFPPARQQMPWLAHLARLERAWLDAWHAADAAPMEAGALSAIPPESLAETRFRPRPAARIIAAPFAIADLMEAGRAGLPASPGGAQTVLVTRPHLSVEIRLLDESAAAFAARLLDGATLEEAHAAGEAAGHEAFDIGASLGLLLAAGALAAIEPACATGEDN